MKKLLLTVVSLLVGVSVVSGCSKNGKEADAPTTANQPAKSEKPLEPVTIRLMQWGVYWPDDMFKKLISDPVQKKYPHITMELVNAKGDMDKVIAGGETFDLWATWTGKLPGYKEQGIYEDITPLAKKANFDLNRFDQGVLNGLRGLSDKNELFAMPYAAEYNALYYNKDLFDKFGVPYPKDGMTWEDAVELSKKLARTDGSVKYAGLDEQHIFRLLFPLSLNIVDPKTNKVLEPLDSYKEAFEVGSAIHSVPGNVIGNGPNRFEKDQTLAMIAANNLLTTLVKIPNLNWDVAQYPSYKENPNVYGMSPSGVLIPNKLSKHQDDIMRVFEVLFSDESQTAEVSEFAQASVINNPKYIQQFATGIPELKGKHISSIFKSKPSPGVAYSIYFNDAVAITAKKYDDYLKGTKDVNTALNEAKDEIQKKMDVAK